MTKELSSERGSSEQTILLYDLSGGKILLTFSQGSYGLCLFLQGVLNVHKTLFEGFIVSPKLVK